MREKQLSKRLQAVADMVTPGRRVADVGCDHAYMSIYLVERGIASGCLAMDVNAGPLERANTNIAIHRLTDRIETRLGSGLTQVRPSEADTVLMAGMGGILIRDILRDSAEVSGSLQEWVLQPQSDVDLVRSYIREAGFWIVQENMIKEDGKYYPMFRAIPAENTESAQTVKDAAAGSISDTEIMSAGNGGLPEIPAERLQAVYDRFGELLLRGRNPVLKEFLDYGKGHYAQIIRGMEAAEKLDARAEERLRYMKQEAVYVDDALHFYI